RYPGGGIVWQRLGDARERAFVRRYDDDLDVGIDLPDPPERLDAVETGHPQVESHDVDRIAPEHVERLRAGSRGHHSKARLEREANRFTRAAPARDDEQRARSPSREG